MLVAVAVLVRVCGQNALAWQVDALVVPDTCLHQTGCYANDLETMVHGNWQQAAKKPEFD